MLIFAAGVVPQISSALTAVSSASSALTVALQFSASPTFSGTVYCTASIDSLNTLSSSSLQNTLRIQGSSVSYTVGQISISVSVGSLTPSSTYYIYCMVQNSIGILTDASDIRNQVVTASTLCCKGASFVSTPSFIYTSPTSAQISSSVFQFSLDHLPSQSVVVTPSVFLDGSTATTFTSSPTSISFTSASSSKTSSFLLSGSVTGSYSVRLEFSGTSSSEFSTSSSVSFSLVSSSTVPAPRLSSIVFSNSGAYAYIVFDSATDLAGYSLQTSWTCNGLFSFSGASESSCLWLNVTTVEATLRAATTAQLLQVNGNVTLLGSKIKPSCSSLSAGSSCPTALASAQSKLITAPSTAVSPTIILSLPSQVSTCSDLTVNPTASTGNGGRSWSAVTWSVTNSDGSVASFASSFTAQNGTTLKSFTVSSSSLQAGSYFIALTLTNFLGKTATLTTSLTVVSSADLPLLTISGPATLSMVPSSSLSLSASVQTSACSTSTSSLAYVWTVYKDGTQMSSLKSSSRNALQFQLPSYSLDANSIYTVQVSASSGGATASAQVSVIVSAGGVTARIGGGSSRLISADTALDASSSTDESSSTNSQLSYEWTCSIASSSSFGSDCSTTLFQSQSLTGSSITAKYSAMSDSVIYKVTVTVVSAISGSSGSASTELSRPASGIPTVALAIPSTVSVVNIGSVFSLSGTVQASVGLSCVWIPSVTGVAVTINSTSTVFARNLTAQQVASTFSFPLVMSSSVFSAGSSVTFKLQASALSNGRYTTAAYSQVVVYMNGYPVSGSTTVSPQNGTALATKFEVTTSDWTDDASDMPFTYDFSYQLSASASALTVQSRSNLNVVYTYLPAGLESSNYSVIVIGRVYDIYGASSSADYTSYVAEASTSELDSFLSSGLSDAGVTGNPDQYLSTVNLVATTANTVNCSGSSTTYCSSLNREACEKTPNTCGSCLSGFTGAYGDYNLLCVSESRRRLTGDVGSSCSTGGDCLYGSCSSQGVCDIPLQSCPSNCSGHGTCVYTLGGSNVTQSQCTIVDTSCVPSCQCRDGYGGSACSLNSTELAERTALRSTMCTALQSTLNSSDSSSTLTSSMSASILSVFSPSEISSSEAQDTCFSTLGLIIDASAGTISAADSPDAVQGIIDTLSNFVGTSADATALSNVTSQFFENVFSGSVSGGEDTSFTSTNLRVAFSKAAVIDLSGATLTVPATAAESFYGTARSQLVLNESAASACDTGDGYVALAIGSWASSPYSADASNTLQSSIFRLQSTNSSNSNDNYDATSSEPSYYLVIPFTSTQDLRDPADVVAAGDANYTAPVCSEIADDGTVGLCNNCTLSTYDNSSATFACYDVSVLCGGSASSSGRRRLTESTAVATVYQTGTLLRAVRSQLTKVLSANPFDINVNNAKPILAFISVVAFLVIAGVALFDRMDRRDRTYLLYSKRYKNAKSLELMNKSISELKDQALLESINEMMESDYSYDHFEKMYGKLSGREQFQSVLDAAIPIRPILDNPFGSIVRFFRVLARRHELTMMWSFRSLRRTRILRWFAISNKILMMIFIDTVLFGVFFPDNGSCETYDTEADCTSRRNPMADQALCLWKTSTVVEGSSTVTTTSCSLNPPPSESVPFSVALSVVTLLLQLPLMVLFLLLRTQICSRTPQFSWSIFPLPSDEIQRDIDDEDIDPNDPNHKHKKSGESKGLLHEERNQLIKLRDLTVYRDREDYYDQVVSNNEANFVSEMNYYTMGSSKEESDGLLQEIVKFYTQTANIGMGKHSATDRRYQKLNRIEARVDYMERMLGFSADGTVDGFLGILRSRDPVAPFKKVHSTIVNTRKRTTVLMERFFDMEYSDAFSKNLLLMQYMVQDQFNIVEKFIMKYQFFEYSMFPPGEVNYFVWLLGWIILFGSQVFFVYWIFAWAVTSGTRTFRAWGTNEAISFAQDILVVQIFNTYLIYISGMQIVLPKMKAIYAFLKNLMIKVKHGHHQEVLEEFRLSQYLQPACRIARKKRLRGLQAARMMFYLDDGDVEHFRKATKVTRVMLSVVIWTLLPSLVTYVSESLGDMIMGAIGPMAFSGVTMALYYLFTLSIAALILVLFAILFGYYALNSEKIWPEHLIASCRDALLATCGNNREAQSGPVNASNNSASDSKLDNNNNNNSSHIDILKSHITIDEGNDVGPEELYEDDRTKRLPATPISPAGTPHAPSLATSSTFYNSRLAVGSVPAEYAQSLSCAKKKASLLRQMSSTVESVYNLAWITFFGRVPVKQTDLRRSALRWMSCNLPLELFPNELHESPDKGTSDDLLGDHVTKSLEDGKENADTINSTARGLQEVSSASAETALVDQLSPLVGKEVASENRGKTLEKKKTSLLLERSKTVTLDPTSDLWLTENAASITSPSTFSFFQTQTDQHTQETTGPYAYSSSVLLKIKRIEAVDYKRKILATEIFGITQNLPLDVRQLGVFRGFKVREEKQRVNRVLLQFFSRFFKDAPSTTEKTPSSNSRVSQKFVSRRSSKKASDNSLLLSGEIRPNSENLNVLLTEEDELSFRDYYNRIESPVRKSVNLTTRSNDGHDPDEDDDYRRYRLSTSDVVAIDNNPFRTLNPDIDKEEDLMHRNTFSSAIDAADSTNRTEGDPTVIQSSSRQGRFRAHFSALLAASVAAAKASESADTAAATTADTSSNQAVNMPEDGAPVVGGESKVTNVVGQRSILRLTSSSSSSFRSKRLPSKISLSRAEFDLGTSDESLAEQLETSSSPSKYNNSNIRSNSQMTYAGREPSTNDQDDIVAPTGAPGRSSSVHRSRSVSDDSSSVKSEDVVVRLID